MTGANFTSLVRNYTKTNSTTLTDAEIVLLANTVKDDMASRVVSAKEDDLTLPATRDLIADQREYDFPADKLNSISRVEAKFSTGGDFIRLEEMDLNTYKRSTQESIIVANFANEEGKAFYDIIRGALYIYSGTIVAVTGGLKLYYAVFPQDMVAGDLAGSTDLSIDNSATTRGMPRVFHELWARGISRLWKSTREKPIPLNEIELSWDKDFEEKLSDYKLGSTDRQLTADIPNDDRLQQGNLSYD